MCMTGLSTAIIKTPEKGICLGKMVLSSVKCQRQNTQRCFGGSCCPIYYAFPLICHPFVLYVLNTVYIAFYQNFYGQCICVKEHI